MAQEIWRYQVCFGVSGLIRATVYSEEATRLG